MIQQELNANKNLLVVHLTGLLVVADYLQFNAWAEEILKNNDQFSLICFLEDFHGWSDMSAAWEDAKFGIKYRKKIDKFVLVGDQKREEFMAKIARYFMPAQIKYYNLQQKNEAFNWIAES